MRCPPFSRLVPLSSSTLVPLPYFSFLRSESVKLYLVATGAPTPLVPLAVVKASYNNKWSLSRLGVVACGATAGSCFLSWDTDRLLNLPLLDNSPSTTLNAFFSFLSFCSELQHNPQRLLSSVFADDIKHCS